MNSYQQAKTVVISCDHAGFDLKECVKQHLIGQGIAVKDLGPDSADRVDYPDMIHPLAKAINDGEFDVGIIICGSGNGVAMTANKYPNVRAGISWNVEIAELTRLHNDANVIALPARFISEELALECLNKFLATEFEGGRHATRVDKIAIEC